MPGKRHLQKRDSSGTEYELEAIVAKRKLRNGEIQYRARWSGYGSSDDTWEPLGNVVESQAFADFEQKSRGRRRTPHLRSHRRQRAATSNSDSSNDSSSVAPSRAKKHKRQNNTKKGDGHADGDEVGQAISSSSSSATVAANVVNTSRQKPTIKKKTDEKKQLQQQHSDENNAPVPSTSNHGQAQMLQQMVIVGTNTVIRWAPMRPTAAMLIEGSKKD